VKQNPTPEDRDTWVGQEPDTWDYQVQWYGWDAEGERDVNGLMYPFTHKRSQQEFLDKRVIIPEVGRASGPTVLYREYVKWADIQEAVVAWGARSKATKHISASLSTAKVYQLHKTSAGS
jgi:hypothetical protein